MVLVDHIGTFLGILHICPLTANDLENNKNIPKNTLRVMVVNDLRILDYNNIIYCGMRTYTVGTPEAI